MLVLNRRPNERIIIGDDIIITVIAIRGGVVRLGIRAPEAFRVDREEIRAAKDRDRWLDEGR